MNDSERAAQVEYLPDGAVDARDDAALRNLFVESFSKSAHNEVFRTQRFFRESPAHRWIIRDAEGTIVAHVACHEKVVETSTGELPIAGVAEVATHSAWRRRGLALLALTALHEWARERFEFALLFGVNPIYDKLGYASLERPLGLLGLDDGIWRIERRPIRVLSFQGRDFPEGLIDLRCPLF